MSSILILNTLPAANGRRNMNARLEPLSLSIWRKGKKITTKDWWNFPPLMITDFETIWKCNIVILYYISSSIFSLLKHAITTNKSYLIITWQIPNGTCHNKFVEAKLYHRKVWNDIMLMLGLVRVVKLFTGKEEK